MPPEFVLPEHTICALAQWRLGSAVLRQTMQALHRPMGMQVLRRPWMSCAGDRRLHHNTIDFINTCSSLCHCIIPTFWFKLFSHPPPPNQNLFKLQSLQAKTTHKHTHARLRTYKSWCFMHPTTSVVNFTQYSINKLWGVNNSQIRNTD